MKFLWNMFDYGIRRPFAGDASSSSSRVSTRTGAAKSSTRSTRRMCGIVTASSSTILAENPTNDCNKEVM